MEKVEIQCKRKAKETSTASAPLEIFRSSIFILCSVIQEQWPKMLENLEFFREIKKGKFKSPDIKNLREITLYT